MFEFLLVVHVIIAVAMTAVILMQRSEGGGLTGGSPGGLMSARGAADFLTRTTTILAILFVGLSIALAGLATFSRAPSTIDTSLQKKKDALDASAATPPSAGASNAVTAPVVPLAETALPPVAGPAATPAPVSAKDDAKVKVEEKAKAPAKIVVPPPPSPILPKTQTQPSQNIPAPPVVAPEPVKVPEGLIPPTAPRQ
jgi:preprotein translocase subunit SecG